MLVGVDIGTQGTKTALYDEDGKLLAEATEASKLMRPARGAVEEDPERQVASVCRTIRECVESAGVDPHRVSGVSIDGQMAGVIGVDASGVAITPYDSWLDTRCTDQIDFMKARGAGEVVRKTGCAPSFNHGPKILWWRDEYPDVFARIAAFVQPGGYAAMRLCGLDGEHAFIDRSYLHFSGFADNVGSVWDRDLCKLFGVPVEKLPRIVASHEIVGRVTAGMASQSGLVEGVPVVAGCGDTAASFLSCGATTEGVCVDVAGTASVFAATTARFRPDTERLVLGCGQSAVPGLWHPYAYINGGGMNIEWFARLAQRAAPEETAATLEELNRLAAKVEDPAALPYFVPHFGGRVTPAMPRLRGAWVGLDWSHSLPELYRAILESVALEYRIYRRVLLGLYPDLQLQEIRVTGGGERSSVWNGIKASALEMPVRTIVGGGGAPMGSALLAGYGSGVFDDLKAAADRWVVTGERVDPDPALASVYASRGRKYEELIDTLNRFLEP